MGPEPNLYTTCKLKKKSNTLQRIVVNKFISPRGILEVKPISTKFKNYKRKGKHS